MKRKIYVIVAFCCSALIALANSGISLNEKQKGEWSERWMSKAEYRAFVDSLVSEYGKSLPKGGAWFRGDSAWMSEGRVDTLRQKIIELNEMYERMLDKTKACPEK